MSKILLDRCFLTIATCCPIGLCILNLFQLLKSSTGFPLSCLFLWRPDGDSILLEKNRHLFHITTLLLASCSFLKYDAPSANFFIASCLLLLHDKRNLCLVKESKHSTNVHSVHMSRATVQCKLLSIVCWHTLMATYSAMGKVLGFSIFLYSYMVHCISLPEGIYHIDVWYDHSFSAATMQWSGLQRETYNMSCEGCGIHK